MLARLLVGAAVAWPLVAGAALWQRADPSSPEPTWATLVYVGASRICHQRPERSFHMGDVSWPVCARCAGLYLAAPFAAMAAFLRRPRKRPRVHPAWAVAVAAVPTAVTLMWEWGGLGTPSNLWRFATALPLGAVVAIVLVGVTAQAPPVGPATVDRIN